MVKKSKQLSLSWREVGRGFLTAALGAAVTSLQQILATGGELNKVSFTTIGYAALIAGLSYLTLNVFSNSDGQFAKKEKSSPDRLS